MNHSPPNRLTDQQLVKEVLRGNIRAVNQFIQLTEKLVTQIIYKMIPREADRQDLSQEVYMKAFQHLPGFRFQAKLSTWIAQITYNTCIHYLEKKKLVLIDPKEYDTEPNDVDSMDEIDTSTKDIEQLLITKELGQILLKQMQTLQPLYRTLLTLYHQEQLSYQELSEITQLPEGTVKNYLFRARKALKATLLLHYKKEEL